MAKNYTKDQVKKAIEGTWGLMTGIARNLKCNRNTAKRYIEKFKLHEEIEDESDRGLDLAESQLIKNVLKGLESSLFYYLNNKGQSRGYNRANRMELTKLPESIQIEVIAKASDKT